MSQNLIAIDFVVVGTASVYFRLALVILVGSPTGPVPTLSGVGPSLFDQAPRAMDPPSMNS